MTKLICLNDPTGATGKEIIDFPSGVTATEMIMQVFPDGVDPQSCSIYINNIATVIGESKWLFEPLSDDDVVTFRNDPQGFDPISLLIIGGIALASAGAVILLTPKPQIPGDLGSVKQSPNNTLQGQTNIARPYQGYPCIYGQPRAFPDLGGEAVIYYEDNKKFVEQFMNVGIGEHDVPPLKAGSTLLSSFEDATEEVISPISVPAFSVDTVRANTQKPDYELRFPESFGVYDKFAAGGTINVQGLVVVDQATMDEINLDGEYIIIGSYISTSIGTYHNLMLSEAASVNPNWSILASGGGVGFQDIGETCDLSREEPESISTNDYSFGVNEVDGQELLAANQGDDGLTASVTSLKTDISYTTGSDFTFSVLASTDWDNIKADFDAATGDYSVLINYEYSKQAFPGSYFLSATQGGGVLSTMTLVPDGGGNYYDIVVTGFDGLVSDGGSPSYGQDVTMTERTGEILGPFVTPIECDTLRINITFPQGLKWTDVFLVETNQTDEDGVVVPGTNQEFPFSINANTLDQQFRTLNFTPNYGRNYYSLTIRRTDNSNNSTSNPDLAKLEAFNCIINDMPRSFGNVTLLKIKVPATINATSLRENQINADVTRKTITYNTTTQQIDYTLTASKRFADALLHDYVMVFKRDPATLDLDGLYEIQERIDAVNPELGEFTFTFDDLDIGLDQRMSTILNAARCFKWLDGDIYRFGRDEKQEFIESVITQRDIASADERDYSLQYLSSMPSDYDSIKLQYVDVATNKKAYIYRKVVNGEVFSSAGLRPDTLELAGCYSKAQAEDRADLEIRKVIYNRFIVTDTCLSQCSLLDKGQAVRYAEQYNFNTHDGEILAIVGDVAYTSNTIDWDGASSYFVNFKDEYNNVYYSAVDAVAGNNKAFRVSISGILGNAYLPEGTEQLGSVYVIGTNEELEASAWTVTEKKAANNGNVTLTLTNYDERVFERDVV